MIRSLMHNMEVNGKLDNDLCEKLIQSLFSKKSIRPQYISSSEFDHENLAVAILLASGQYNNAYMLVRWIAYHKQKNFEALEPSPLHRQICLDLEKLKREPSEFSMQNMFSSKADLLEDIGWLYPQAHQMPKRPHHYLLVGIPVLVVKMHQLKRQKSIKEKGFSTFLLGTHPMLGEESPVLKLRGMYPILKIINDYSQNQDEVQHDIEIVDEQIHELLWLCRIRSLVLEIVDPNKQPMWTLGNFNAVLAKSSGTTLIYSINLYTFKHVKLKLSRRVDSETDLALFFSHESDSI